MCKLCLMHGSIINKHCFTIFLISLKCQNGSDVYKNGIFLLLANGNTSSRQGGDVFTKYENSNISSAKIDTATSAWFTFVHSRLFFFRGQNSSSAATYDFFFFFSNHHYYLKLEIFSLSFMNKHCLESRNFCCTCRWKCQNQTFRNRFKLYNCSRNRIFSKKTKHLIDHFDDRAWLISRVHNFKNQWRV